MAGKAKSKKKAKQQQQGGATNRNTSIDDDAKRAEAAVLAGMAKLGITKDTDFFAPPPPSEDCLICMVPLPKFIVDAQLLGCCGKRICLACYLGVSDAFVAQCIEGKKPSSFCPFCRSDVLQENEQKKLIENLVEKNDVNAILEQVDTLCKGNRTDRRKAFNYLLRAVELGSPKGFWHLGACYMTDKGNDHKLSGFLPENMIASQMCMTAAAIGGVTTARCTLGLMAVVSGNKEIGLKHLQIAAAAGDKSSLSEILKMVQKGDATREDYKRAIDSFKIADEEQSSDARKEYDKKLEARSS